jgi:N,N'-diacetyllegionaminate synthase
MSNQIFRIGDREVGLGCPCLIIGEIAQAHDGSLGTAHAYIDAIAEAGADAVKFQTHIAAAESTVREPWRVRFSRQDATRFDYWKRMEFTEEQWAGLRDHARERRLLFLSSPFSLAGVDLLERLGVPAWKVASGEIGTKSLLDRMIATAKPLLMSSGMSDLAELDRAVGWARDGGVPAAVFQCTTQYPCPPERVGLNLLEEYRSRYELPVGLSDHSGTPFPGLAAVTLGASFLEVHVTFHRGLFGPDVPASLTVEELARLVEGVRFIERMQRHPVDKDALAVGFAPLRSMFGKGVVAARALPSGYLLQETDLDLKKPADGIPAAELAGVAGRRLQRALAPDDPVRWEDLE